MKVKRLLVKMRQFLDTEKGEKTVTTIGTTVVILFVVNVTLIVIGSLY